MIPDSPKEYVLSFLRNLIKLVEKDKIVLGSINTEFIGFPPPYDHIPRGRKITLELFDAKPKP